VSHSVPENFEVLWIILNCSSLYVWHETNNPGTSVNLWLVENEQESVVCACTALVW
jgi:hypothetical protein